MSKAKKKTKRELLESALGASLIRTWITDGPGPARWGWATVHPAKILWEGRTLDEIQARLEESEKKGE